MSSQHHEQRQTWHRKNTENHQCSSVPLLHCFQHPRFGIEFNNPFARSNLDSLYLKVYHPYTIQYNSRSEILQGNRTVF